MLPKEARIFYSVHALRLFPDQFVSVKFVNSQKKLLLCSWLCSHVQNLAQKASLHVSLDLISICLKRQHTDRFPDPWEDIHTTTFGLRILRKLHRNTEELDVLLRTFSVHRFQETVPCVFNRQDVHSQIDDPLGVITPWAWRDLLGYSSNSIFCGLRENVCLTWKAQTSLSEMASIFEHSASLFSALYSPFTHLSGFRKYDEFFAVVNSWVMTRTSPSSDNCAIQRKYLI